ncbi:MAG TPA: exodeoxyribonuclease VII large subunit, partial [Bacteroidales bacterium]|nr:exodeoxyribonuclease VII large subunit [Bacteroidales bacterium]
MEQYSILGKIQNVYTLYEVTSGIEKVIKNNYPNFLWIKAEIAKLNLYPKSGHCYIDLVEKDKNNINAQLKGIIWANNYNRIRNNFIKITGEDIKDGMKILFYAKIKFDSIHGLALDIQEIEAFFTLGEMAREKRETINKLISEGIFNKNKELTLVELPRRIAIISVETSKGFADFISKLNKYQNKFKIFYKLYPSILQGDAAIESIYTQLKLIKKVHKYYDCLLIIRGGGGEIGLSCYDNFTIAKEVANFPIPVITGIGHSTNETVVEMVAFKNLITPTDVAYFILDKFISFSNKIEEKIKLLTKNTERIINLSKTHLKSLNNLIIKDTQKKLQSANLKLELLKIKFSSSLKHILQENLYKIIFFTDKIKYIPLKIINLQRKSLNITFQEIQIS